MAWVRCSGGSGMPRVFYLVKNGVVNSNFNALGSPTVYDSVNGRLTVQSTNALRFLNFSPSIDISKYTYMHIILQTSSNNSMRVDYAIDNGQLQQIGTSSAGQGITQRNFPISGDKMTTLQLLTLPDGDTYYIYNIWFD